MKNLDERAGDFALASTLLSYPDDEVRETLAALGPRLDEASGAHGIVRALVSGDADEPRSSYVDLFDVGAERVPLYETEYGRMRGMSKGHDLADIGGFYRAFGLEIDAPEMLDHIAVELEFYAVLLAKAAHLARVGDEAGQEIVDGARRGFLASHLGPFAGAAAARASGRAAGAHRDALLWCGELVSRECEAMGVSPSPLGALGADDEDEMKCGAVHLPMAPA